MDECDRATSGCSEDSCKSPDANDFKISEQNAIRSTALVHLFLDWRKLDILKRSVQSDVVGEMFVRCDPVPGIGGVNNLGTGNEWKSAAEMDAGIIG